MNNWLSTRKRKYTDGWPRFLRSFQLIVGAGLLLGLAAGCSTTYQARDTTTTGFLGDYSQLQKGTNDQVQLYYINPQANFKAYDKIIIDPIKVYAARQRLFTRVSNADLQALVNYFDATLREHLQDNYTIVAAPGPGTMRLRLAITEAEGAKVARDVISSVIPIGIAISAVKRVAVGTATAVGSARMESEIQDAQTGVRLAAVVDAREGRKVTGHFDKLEKWRTAEDAFDYWAEWIDARLAEQRAK